MSNNARDSYLQERVLSADPIELVHLLYGGAIAAVLEARRQLAAGEIAARSRAISSACDIVVELGGALDLERGGEIARNLGRVYDYVLGRLLEANAKADDRLLAEVLGLLSTLAEGWEQDREPEPLAIAAGSAWTAATLADSEMACKSRAWSF